MDFEERDFFKPIRDLKGLGKCFQIVEDDLLNLGRQPEMLCDRERVQRLHTRSSKKDCVCNITNVSLNI